MKQTQRYLGVKVTHPEREPSIQFELTVKISNAEYQRYLEASRTMGRFQRDQQLLLLAMWNLEEYFDLPRDYTAAKSLPKLRNRYLLLEINRRLINYLTAVRAYLNFTKVKIEETVGPSSSCYERYQTYQGIAYEKYFSYRFLHHLRNYAQHGDLPFTNLVLGSNKTDGPEGGSLLGYEVTLTRDVLLDGSSFNWNSRIRQELEDGPAEIPLDPYLAEHAELLVEISKRVNNDLLPHFAKYAECLAQLNDRVRGGGNRAAGLLEFWPDPDNGHINLSVPNRSYFPNIELAKQVLEEDIPDIEIPDVVLDR